MNNQRRKRISVALDHIRAACSILEDVLQQERDALENWPENLQGSERYYLTEDAADLLDEILSDLQETCRKANDLP